MISRRSLVAIAAAATATLALAGCAPTTSAQAGAAATSQAVTGTKGTVTVFISGDTNVQQLWDDAIIPAFEKDNPGASVKTTLDLHGEHDAQSLAKLASAVKSGEDPGYDLVDAGFIQAAGSAGLLKKVTAKTISNLATVPKATVTAGDGYGIPYRASSVLLAYDSTKVKTPPKTLDALIDWIKANPGQFAYNSPSTGGSGQAFVTTVLDKYLTTSERKKMETGYDKSLESKWDKGFTELASLNKSMYQKGVYPNGNDQVLNLLGTGNIEMAPVWSDQTITAEATGTLPKTVKYVQIANPSFTGSASYLGIPKTAAHAKTAEKLANFVLSTKGQALIAKTIAGYPVITLDNVPAATRAKFAAADPSNLRPSYYSTMASDMNNLWDAKVPGQ
ncbi:MAG: putative substrate-binding transport protein [Frondihabitans sp.]|nr:putative substrate-binding transport protein [Frondihabitans sp.]